MEKETKDLLEIIFFEQATKVMEITLDLNLTIAEKKERLSALFEEFEAFIERHFIERHK